MAIELNSDEDIFLYIVDGGEKQSVKNVPQLSFYKSTMITASSPKRIPYVSFDSGGFSSESDLELSKAELQIAKRYLLWNPEKFKGTPEPQAVKRPGYLNDVLVLTQNRDGIPQVIDTKVAFLVTDGAEGGRPMDAIAVAAISLYDKGITHILRGNDLLPANEAETIRQNIIEPIKAAHDRLVSEFVEIMNSTE